MKLHARLETQLRDLQANGLPGQARGFWTESPDAVAARALRANKEFETAFSVLLARIDGGGVSPALLRELYHLYKATKLLDLCYRTLLQIERMTEISGTLDHWVLETLAGVCEELGTQHRSMFAVAIIYWSKLETLSGTSKAAEKAAVLVRQNQLDFEYRPSGVSGADL